MRLCTLKAEPTGILAVDFLVDSSEPLTTGLAASPPALASHHPASVCQRFIITMWHGTRHGTRHGVVFLARRQEHSVVPSCFLLTIACLALPTLLILPTLPAYRGPPHNADTTRMNDGGTAVPPLGPLCNSKCPKVRHAFTVALDSRGLAWDRGTLIRGIFYMPFLLATGQFSFFLCTPNHFPFFHFSIFQLEHFAHLDLFISNLANTISPLPAFNAIKGGCVFPDPFLHAASARIV